MEENQSFDSVCQGCGQEALAYECDGMYLCTKCAKEYEEYQSSLPE